jgi:hypothetical protein
LRELPFSRPLQPRGESSEVPLAKLQALYLGRRGEAREHRFTMLFAEQLLGGAGRFLVLSPS